jgi:type IV pilus assembly protein PilW
MRAHPLPARRAQQGAGIVETMVGILIGLIVVLAIYNVFAVAEGYKRTAVGAADAQTTGLYAQFVLRREIGNAGNAMSGAAADLATCTIGDPNWPAPAGFYATAGARPTVPVPVMIRDGGSNDTSDRLIVTYSTAPRVITPMLFIDKVMVATSDPFYIQSPNGFRANDRVIVINMAGGCELTTVTAVTPGDHLGNVVTGIVGISHPPVARLYFPGSAADGGRLLNLGQIGEATRTLYDVVNGQLRTTDLFAAAPAVPIAQNVVLMKAQYGVDCADNGVVTWTTATASNLCGDGRNFAPDDIVPAPPGVTPWANAGGRNYAQNLAQIRAIRIGIVVRSDEPDLKNPALVGQTAVLFDCSTHDAACQGRTPITSAVLADGYRHRVYETTVPMINAIYNNGT